MRPNLDFDEAFRRSTELCAAAAGGLAFLALLSWGLDAWRIGALGRDYVPMAPSTACLPILLSCAVVGRGRFPARLAANRFAVVVALTAGAMSLLVWAQHLFGFELPVERWLAPPHQPVP